MNGLSLAPTIIACECAGHSGGILGNLVLSVCLLGI